MIIIGVILGLMILTVVIVVFNCSLKHKQQMDFFRKQEKESRGERRGNLERISNGISSLPPVVFTQQEGLTFGVVRV